MQLEPKKPWWVVNAELKGWTDVLWDDNGYPGWRGEPPGGNGGIKMNVPIPWFTVNNLEEQKVEQMALDLMKGGKIKYKKAIRSARKLLHALYGGPDA